MKLMILVLLAYGSNGLEATVLGNPTSTMEQCVSAGEKTIKQLGTKNPGARYGYICKPVKLDYTGQDI